MATANPFDLLGDDDNDDPSQLIAAVQKQKEAAAAAAPKKPVPATAPSKLPTKPLPPAQAVREARSNAPQARGGGRGGFGRSGGRGGRGYGSNRDFGNGNVEENTAGGYGGGGGGEEGERGSYGGPRQPYHGPRRGGYGNGEEGGDSDRPPRRVFERRSGTGRGSEFKREGAGRANWGTASDDVIVQEAEESAKVEDKTFEKQLENESPGTEANKDNKDAVENNEEKEQEDKEMTLDEYEKIKEEKRKALLALKSEERKVEIDKDLGTMLQLSNKKSNDDIFVKLGNNKDSKKQKENLDREERAKKSVSINEFLKPAEGGRYYSPGGRGRWRGRGAARGFSGNAPATEVKINAADENQFPSLGGK